jgi:3-phosphoshikimate 1-carboxyvinyltransferase
MEEAATCVRELGAGLEWQASGPGLQIGVSGKALAGNLALGPGRHQLKTMCLLAMCQAEGLSTLQEQARRPDHTDRFLGSFGAAISRTGHRIEVTGPVSLAPRPVRLPPDISAALPVIAACCAVPGTSLTLPLVGVNPTRIAALRCLQRAGAVFSRERDWQLGAEPVCSMAITGGATLAPLVIAPNAAFQMLDDIPLLAGLATQCNGQSHLRGVEPLRKSLPDVLTLTAQILRDFGATVELDADHLSVYGRTRLHGAEVNCADDLELGRLGLLCALLADGESVLHGMRAVEERWPELVFLGQPTPQ